MVEPLSIRFSPHKNIIQLDIIQLDPLSKYYIVIDHSSRSSLQIILQIIQQENPTSYHPDQYDRVRPFCQVIQMNHLARSFSQILSSQIIQIDHPTNIIQLDHSKVDHPNRSFSQIIQLDNSVSCLLSLQQNGPTMQSQNCSWGSAVFSYASSILQGKQEL